MNKEECIKKIIEVFPEYHELYLSHISDYGEILLHVFIAETINEPLIQLLESHSDVKKYCEIVESMWKNGDDAVRNVVDVTILERLSDDEAVWQKFGKAISPDFRSYINNEVLVHNVMMAAVKRLEKKSRT